MLGALMFLKKVPIWLWVAGAAFGVWKYQQNKISSLESELTISILSQDTTTQINDSLFARIAVDRVEKDSLRGVILASKELNGELIAAARITLQPEEVSSDSVVSVVDTVFADNTRMAQFIDTTDAGVLDATVTAPPSPARLRLSYTFSPAPITPEVGLLRLEDETAIFIVSYRGGTVEISAPFARIPSKTRLFVPYVAAYRDLLNTQWVFAAGAEVNPGAKLSLLGNLVGIVEFQQTNRTANIGSESRLMLGGRWRFK